MKSVGDQQQTNHYYYHFHQDQQHLLQQQPPPQEQRRNHQQQQHQQTEHHDNMAGNIVKWWKHKILGGYKQFSVLQECATDSEDLIYPIRAPSTCSAPPDLLLTSNGGGGNGCGGINNGNGSSNGDRDALNSGSNNRLSQSVPKDVKITAKAKIESKECNGINGGTNEAINNTTAAAGATTTTTPSTQRMFLEEFTCDVSVEGDKSHPLQFSFTFYDLDGHHHGKISKDDIAGIVYTIYESIGKSVVVPYCGSKTINVRLTVSPDTAVASKNNTTAVVNNKKETINGIISRKYQYKAKKLIPTDYNLVIEQQQPITKSKINGGDVDCSDIRIIDQESINLKYNNKSKRNHSDNLITINNKISSNNHNHNHLSHHQHQKQNQRLSANLSCCRTLHLSSQINGELLSTKPNTTTTMSNNNCTDENSLLLVDTENLYESINNLKSCSQTTVLQQPQILVDIQQKEQLQQQEEDDLFNYNNCRDCSSQRILIDAAISVVNSSPPSTPIIATTSTPAAALAIASASITTKQQTPRRLMRKSRSKKQKTHKSSHARVRSLSVGNENCYRSGGHHHHHLHQTHHGGALQLVSDREDKCLNNLRRNDLIDIIRESMEKNRMCFQSNGKSTESPIQRHHHHQHRHRSNTVSKFDHHQTVSYPQQPNNINTTTTTAATTPNNNYSHQSPAHLNHQYVDIIPPLKSSPLPTNNIIYHSTANRCGYDSFLHATICTTNNITANTSALSHHHDHHHLVHHPEISTTSQQQPHLAPNHHHQHQPTVNNLFKTSSPLSKIHHHHHHRVHRSSRHKSNDLNATITSLNAATTTTPQLIAPIASPQLQGYTKFQNSLTTSTTTTTTTKLLESKLNQLNPNLTPEQTFSQTINHVEKWLTEKEQILAAAAASGVSITPTTLSPSSTTPTLLTSLTIPPVISSTITTPTPSMVNNIATNLITTTNTATQIPQKYINTTTSKDDKNFDNLINNKMFMEKLKLTEKSTEKQTESPMKKKVFNKEVLLPINKRLYSKNKLLSSELGEQQINSNNNRSNGVATVLEYSSVPVTVVDQSECENLLINGGSIGGVGSCSENSSSQCNSPIPPPPSSPAHSLYLQQQRQQQNKYRTVLTEDRLNGSLTSHLRQSSITVEATAVGIPTISSTPNSVIGGAGSASGTTVGSDGGAGDAGDAGDGSGDSKDSNNGGVYRYVHEHIHHHYHHFENASDNL